MKRVLLSALMACVFVGQASAEMYTLDYATAIGFHQLPADGSSGTLMAVFNDTGQVYAFAPEGFPEDMVVRQYADVMRGEVGFVGYLSGDLSWMRIGAEGNFGTGNYTRFGAFLANDNNSTWQVRLVTNAETPTDADWVSIDAGDSRWLELDFAPTALTMVGFDVRLNVAMADHPSLTDSFHVSVVPLQGGAVLGVLGLAAAGLRLRKFI